MDNKKIGNNTAVSRSMTYVDRQYSSATMPIHPYGVFANPKRDANARRGVRSRAMKCDTAAARERITLKSYA